MSVCSTIKHQYESLKTLKQEFVSACEKAGNIDTLTNQQLIALQRLKHNLEIETTSFVEHLFVSPKAAEAIMNKDMGKDEKKRQFFGVNEIKIAFGFDIPKKDLPPIPFSTQELKEAKERGDYLIYRPDTYRPATAIADATPTPLTMQTIAELVQPTLTAINTEWKARYTGNDWCENESFYTKDTPRKGWVLVSKEPLSDSTNKNYLQQTDLLVKELHTLYPATDTRPIATTYHEAIKDFHSKRAEIEQLLKDNKWKEAADILELLLITKLTRHSAPEAYYDAMLLRASTKSDSLLSNIYTWTSSRSSSGDLVHVGNAGSSGALVDGWGPVNRDDDLGVSFVRSGPRVSRPS